MHSVAKWPGMTQVALEPCSELNWLRFRTAVGRMALVYTIGNSLCSSEMTQDNLDVLYVQTLRRLEFAQGQRNWTAGGTDGWREPAEDAHKQSENDPAGEKSRRDAEGECQM
jgi:hypothetical protein